LTGIPIGVFDSGVGGLTVLRALREAMPATDGAARFARVGSTFLGETLAAEAVEIIDL
jgi:hypothetical protein